MNPIVDVTVGNARNPPPIVVPEINKAALVIVVDFICSAVFKFEGDGDDDEDDDEILVVVVLIASPSLLRGRRRSLL